MPTEPAPSTVPARQPFVGSAIKPMPVVILLTAGMLLIGGSAVYNAFHTSRKPAAKSTLQTQPSTADPQQVAGFNQRQDQLAAADAQREALEQQMAALRKLDAQSVPTPEMNPALPMTPAQSAAIYGGSANAPQRTSPVSEARAQAAQKAAEQAAERERQRQAALSSDTVAVDFAPQHDERTGQQAQSPSPSSVLPPHEEIENASSTAPAAEEAQKRPTDPMRAYDFDAYGGKLYRVFEGTVLEGVVTNHIDGSMAGPILIMLTTDYYSHDHQQLLLPQGTRLIGEVEAIGNQQQHKLMVVFHRAVCPDGFSLDIDKYAGLDPLGTTGLATKVDHGYLQAFAAAAAVGGLGGLAQIGNGASVLTPGSQIRNGFSSQTSEEGEQILNHFLNRLPIITLKEGSRARVYIGKDILIPSYAEHRVDPAL
jgi:type IV secretion system protein VirB10